MVVLSAHGKWSVAVPYEDRSTVVPLTSRAIEPLAFRAQRPLVRRNQVGRKRLCHHSFGESTSTWKSSSDGLRPQCAGGVGILCLETVEGGQSIVVLAIDEQRQRHDR